MTQLRIGVLGATRGMDFAIRTLAANPHARVTDICESHAVVLANCANEHAPYAIRALHLGKHVLSEVLPVQTLAEAVALCEAVESSGKVYGYAENYCYFDQNFEMRLRYDRGDIGELVSAECDFINDCSYKWHLLTRGERDHWRNYVPSTFYCTHSIGPMLFISGQRPLYVVGMETPALPYMTKHGARSGSAAMEIMKLANGAMAKSTNGNLKHPYLAHCRMIGTKGSMESNPWQMNRLHVAIEGTQTQERVHSFDREEYLPETFSWNGRAADCGSPSANGLHYAVEFFIGSILGDEIARRYLIDVYQALDMGLPGLLGYRSILQGSMPVTVPDFRDKTAREPCRNDNACTDPRVAHGDDLLPSCSSRDVTVSDDVYAAEAERFQQNLRQSFRLGAN
jgi:predicted dehydrogenase